MDTVRTRRLGVAGLVLGLAATLLSISGPAAGPAAAAAAPAPRKVMIVGDSVAHQFDGDYTWRYRLAMEFRRQQKPIDFVGPFRWAYGEYRNYLVSNWDSSHGSQGATLIKDFLDIEPVDGAPNWGRFNIRESVTTYQPAVLVSVMGNNDVNNGMVLKPSLFTPSIREQYEAEGRTPEVEARVDDLVTAVLADYKSFLASARRARWNIKVVVSEITSQLVEPWVRAKVNAALAAQLTSTKNSPVVIARTNDPLLARPGYTVDGIHTTPTGDLVIAQRIAQGIHTIWSYILGAPRIRQSAVAWNPVLTPRIAVAGRRITVDWGLAARRNTVLGIRLKFVDVRTGRTTYATYAQRASWTSASQRPGEYRIRLQGIRGNMVSTWGPAIPVTVR